MSPRSPNGELAWWSAIGGATLLGGWLLRRSLGTAHAESSADRTSTVDSIFGVEFGKPLPRAIVGGGWGDKRPGRYHYSIDLSARTGTPIYAAAAGTVVVADSRGKSTAGKYVVIKSGDVYTRYLHMSVVKGQVGQQVRRGDVIGLVGSTGYSSAPHLHLDVFVSDELLDSFRRTYGTPTPEFPKKRRWGTAVPAETLIPVDGYTKRIRAAAKKWRVRLRGAENRIEPLVRPYEPRPVARTYDSEFNKYGRLFRIPPAYLRALAKRESNLNRLDTSGAAWGLMQIIDAVRQDFNKRHRTRYMRVHMLRAGPNVRVGASALRTIIDSYQRNHSDIANMREDWLNPRFVELLTLGWNAGWSEVAGVGRVVRYLEARGVRDITIDHVHRHARAAGAIKYLSNNLRVWWCKTVALLYFHERKRDAAAGKSVT